MNFPIDEDTWWDDSDASWYDDAEELAEEAGCDDPEAYCDEV